MLPVPPEFNSPELEVGDQIEIFETNLAPHDPIYGKVVKIDHLDRVWITLDGFYGEWLVNPDVTAWKKQSYPSINTPTIRYGVKCAKCNEYFEHAAVVAGFKCWSCRQ